MPNFHVKHLWLGFTESSLVTLPTDINNLECAPIASRRLRKDCICDA